MSSLFNQWQSSANDQSPRLIAENIVSGCRQLATLPVIATRVMRLIHQVDVSNRELVKLIQHDQVLTAGIMKVANSSFYGFKSMILSLDRALVVLGQRTIRNIVFAISLNKLFAHQQAVHGFDPAHLWIHSVAVGHAAAWLSTHVTNENSEEAFLAGLMHDIGITIAMQNSKVPFADVLGEFLLVDDLAWPEIEMKRIGTHHGEIGAAACRAWGVPGRIEHAILHHHQPQMADQAHRKLVETVDAADRIVTWGRWGFSDRISLDDRTDKRIAFWVGDQEHRVDDLIDALPQVVAEFAVATFHA